VSHVTAIELRVNDLDCLSQGGQELGMELVPLKEFRWYGTHVGDYPLPAGFKKEDMGKCDYVLRIKNNNRAYEVGVCKARDGQDGFVLLWDFWNGGYGLRNAIGQNGDKLKQAYASQVAQKHLQQLSREGFRTVKQRRADGTIVLVATGEDE